MVITLPAFDSLFPKEQTDCFHVCFVLILNNHLGSIAKEEFLVSSSVFINPLLIRMTLLNMNNRYDEQLLVVLLLFC